MSLLHYFKQQMKINKLKIPFSLPISVTHPKQYEKVSSLLAILSLAPTHSWHLIQSFQYRISTGRTK
jgi:hypothetical protein